MNLILVSGPEMSSNRIVYPTSAPIRHPTSSETRLATETAATFLGCVHPSLPFSSRPSSAKYCAICVVFPDPVSPTTTRIWFYRSARDPMHDREAYGLDGLNKLVPQFVDRQTLPLLLYTHRSDLSVRRNFIGSFPGGHLSASLTGLVELPVGCECLVVGVCHGVEPWLIDVSGLRVGSFVLFHSFQIFTFFRKRCTG
jgi:hypothetical protein